LKSIKSIAVRGIRGVRKEVTLNLEGKSLVVRGDNGTGKSSIVAGLMWALTGAMEPSPRAKKATEEAYRANILEKASDAQVVVVLMDGSQITAIPGNVTDSGDAALLRTNCHSSSPFLLRRQLLGILEARPVDRFKYLETFLELETADSLREDLVARARDHQRVADDKRAEAERLIEAINSRIPTEHRLHRLKWSTLVAALGAWARKLDTAPTDALWPALLEIAARLQTLMRGEELARSRSLLVTAVDACATMTECPEDPSSLADKVASLSNDLADGQLVELLEIARTYIAGQKDDSDCPLCGAASPNLLARVEEKLAQLEELRLSQAKLSQNISSWRSAMERLARAMSAVRSAIAGGALTEGSIHLGLNGEDLPQLAGDGIETARALAAGKAGSIKAEVEEVRTTWLATLQQARDALPSEANAEGIRQLLGAIEAGRKAELAITLAEEVAEREAQTAGFYDTFADAIRTSRQDVAQALLNKISGLVGEFYEAIHPSQSIDEETGAPTIEIQRRAAGTAHLRGKFHALDVDDPRWVYSDGHLDTVAICIFLALRRFRADRDGAKDCRLLVLDDVVLSVDLSHGRRFLDLLRERFEDHQVLILTHNGLFCDWCVQKLPAFKRLAITSWSLEAGPRLGEYRSALEYVEDQIEHAAHPKLLAQAVMNLMDEWLGQARFEYALAIPARRGEEYTLTEIWEPFAKQMAATAKALGPDAAALSSCVNDLRDLPKMRNRLAAHDNDFAREYPLVTVREMAIAAAKLVTFLYCPVCANFATGVPSIRELELLRCSPRCEKIRLVRPSKTKPEVQPV
jgi:recombinational DNA repair ATPase RecF